MNLSLTKNDVVRVEWEDLGEGWYGDYNPDDPEDTELLRFTVSHRREGEWEQYHDASYCTQMPVDTDERLLVKALGYIMQEVYSEAEADDSIKRRCEELSWIGPESTDVRLYGLTT